MLVLGILSNMTSKYGTNFCIIYAITNETTVKLTQINRTPAASKTYLAETFSNNSGIGITYLNSSYTLGVPTPGWKRLFVRLSGVLSLMATLCRFSPFGNSSTTGSSDPGWTIGSSSS